MVGRPAHLERATGDRDWRSTPEELNALLAKILRTTGQREKVESIGRQMRYVRAWSRDSEGWTWQERDVGGGAKEYRLVMANYEEDQHED